MHLLTAAVAVVRRGLRRRRLVVRRSPGRHRVHCVATGIASLFLDHDRVRCAAFLLRRAAQARARAGHGLGFQREIVRLDGSCDRRRFDDGGRPEKGRDVAGGRDGSVEIARLGVTLGLGVEVFGGRVVQGVGRVVPGGRGTEQAQVGMVVGVAEGDRGGRRGRGGRRRLGRGGGGRGAVTVGRLSRRLVVMLVVLGRVRLVMVRMVQMVMVVVGRRRVVVVQAQRRRRGRGLEQAARVEAEHVKVCRGCRFRQQECVMRWCNQGF